MSINVTRCVNEVPEKQRAHIPISPYHHSQPRQGTLSHAPSHLNQTPEAHIIRQKWQDDITS